LLVDSDAVLPSTIPAKLLQAIPWRDAQIVELLSRIHHHKFATSTLLDVVWQLLAVDPTEDVLSLGVCERLDHPPAASIAIGSITRYVKRQA
jgi:hypothetical protein